MKKALQTDSFFGLKLALLHLIIGKIIEYHRYLIKSVFSIITNKQGSGVKAFAYFYGLT
jgi:hypothetical protein